MMRRKDRDEICVFHCMSREADAAKRRAVEHHLVDVRIVIRDLRPAFVELVHDANGRRFPNVADVGLVGGTKHQDLSPLD
jgi:hypothetical protein